ncbi:transposon-encoded TnpW family protein [Streptococcus sp. 27098_8_73]|uniref:transposon-encoded TnpW family protein n=1 Tax=Streptococcus sp. 27098_8_73 TaxID=3003668 RepID=UPI00352D7333
MEELKNTDKQGLSTKRKIEKTTYEVVDHFNENTTEIMQDKLTRIMLRELRRKLDEKKMILIKKSLTSSNRKNSEVYVS